MNIIDAIHDEKLFRPFLGDDLSSWRNWLVMLRVLYGLPTKPKHADLIRHTTGRSRKHLPDNFSSAYFITGRRSGKSRSVSLIGAWEALFAGHEKRLSKGEVGIVCIVAPSRRQSRIVRDYLRAIFQAPLLAKEVVRETQEGFELRNGVCIEILTGDWRLVRGYTLLAAIVDEAAFFGYDSESKVKSDSELLRALTPALSTVGGKLICITSPHAMAGAVYNAWKRHWGNDQSNVLCVKCASRVFNPCLSQAIVDAAMEEDLASAKAEYLGEFRDDVALFLPRSVVEACVIANRQDLLPRRSIEYSAFCDLSGGRHDDAALCIGHKINEKIIVDCLKRWKSPFEPRLVLSEMQVILRQYGLRKVTGDNYAANFVSDGFKDIGVKYERSDKNRSELYLELLPRICSQEIELPDNAVLIDQISQLERKVRSGSVRDIVDHPHGGKDDVSVVVAGLAAITTKSRKLIKAL